MVLSTEVSSRTAILNEDWSLLTRAIIPIVHQPWPESTDGSSDTNLTTFLTPARAGKIIWGMGPTLLMRTATDEIICNVHMQPIFAKVIAPLLDALPDAILLVDEGGLILFANRAVRSLLGYEPPELVDQPLSVLLPVRSRELHERLMASFWLEPRSRPMTSRPFLHALSKAGVEVPVTISLAPVILSGQRRCVAALRDASLIQRQITTTPGKEGIRQ